VVSLEADGCEEVFDLAVPGLHNVVVSNIFAHNSGAIEQDADLVMFIYRGDIHEAEKGGVAKLVVAKQRNGPTGEVSVHLYDRAQRRDTRALWSRQASAARRGLPAGAGLPPTPL
jgi:replicative DNA helicase